MFKQSYFICNIKKQLNKTNMTLCRLRLLYFYIDRHYKNNTRRISPESKSNNKSDLPKDRQCTVVCSYLNCEYKTHQRSSVNIEQSVPNLVRLKPQAKPLQQITFHTLAICGAPGDIYIYIYIYYRDVWLLAFFVMIFKKKKST